MGSFETQILVLIAEWPDANWPDCAKLFLDISRHPDIWKVIQKFSADRAEQPIAEVGCVSGGALDDLRYRRRDKVEELDKRFKKRSQSESPSRTLTCANAA